MESELPILLYLFSFALTVTTLVPACRFGGVQQLIQILCRSQPDQNTSLTRS